MGYREQRTQSGGIHYAWIVTAVTCLALIPHAVDHGFPNWIFLSHQVGAALASYIGGLVYDLTGTYNLAFISAACLGVLAAGMVLLVPEPPRATPERPAVQEVPVFGRSSEA